ncbi:protoheme IX farnesyltransferase [Leucobacter sp. OH2974_COT-288]|uniref:Protoheme IX farnesyltransferase n=1 Tax=Canibacter oris TaxID=1365628 RepID=A0A840DGH5_9MICO|nr:heme o synthase [Canibacter oris]MBB4070875.1 protoheme IX farnesyltransferase [Canibacter oris]MBB4071843.1 protoheme IX farnesyltransferase [Canibacter oris]RRD36252.1 protoheme IX farnesyltransferase [Leucobacter sp. OH2974_COT-288]
MSTQACTPETSAPRAAVKPTLMSTVKAYVALTKPRVMELLLVVTVPAMILAARGLPDLWLVIATLIGGGASAGSAGAFNCYIDRDMDRKMNRTKGRPLVTGEISDRNALIFAWVLGIFSVVWMAIFTNWLATLLTALANFFYVVIYTLILKRHSEQNIIWGGIAGCFPVLIGWAAVTETLSAEAWIFFLVIFLWTPPHYWPLSIKYREDYAAASVPMLGVVRARSTVSLQIILYTWATVASSLLLIPVAPMGWTYTVIAFISGAYFIYEAHKLYGKAIRGSEGKPMRVFHGSIAYLTVISLAMALDPLLPAWNQFLPVN